MIRNQILISFTLLTSTENQYTSIAYRMVFPAIANVLIAVVNYKLKTEVQKEPIISLIMMEPIVKERLNQQYIAWQKRF